MPKIQYIGVKTENVGKLLFEILTNLKNFGVGRMIHRGSLTARYPEPTYFIIKQAEPIMDEKLWHGRVFAEYVFRGRRYPELYEVKDVFLPDFQLISKEEEEVFKKGYEIRTMGELGTEIFLPQFYKVPPLMEEFLKRRRIGTAKEDYKEGFRLPLIYPEEDMTKYRNRIVEDETTTMKTELDAELLKGVEKVEITK